MLPRMAHSLKFTLAAVRGLPPAPQGQRVEYIDTVQPGLRLRVTATGAKSYLVLARIKGGKMERVTLGSTDKLTPESARTDAKAIIAKMATGQSYAAESRATRGEVTFSELFALYIEGNSMRPRSKAEFEGLHRRYIKDSAIGKLKLGVITHKNIMDGCKRYRCAQHGLPQLHPH